MQLDPSQAKAVMADGHCMVSAGPGSGKTRMLTSRATRLLRDHDSGLLVAVTFTRDGANELSSRILEDLPSSYKARLLAGTYHSLALQQLQSARINGRRLWTRKILREGERRSIIRRALESTGVDMKHDEAASIIDAIKSTINPPPDAGPIAELYNAYTDILNKGGACDFSDILLSAVRGMRTGKLAPLPAHWLLGDEYQDTDDVQYNWMLCHAQAGAAVTIVGDDDQSIYGWRNAMGYSGMMRFKEELNSDHITLDTNYRCAPEVLEPALRLIQRNHDRVPKKIRPARKPGGRVALHAALDRTSEAQHIARVIEVDGKPEEWAILARTNQLLDAVSLVLASMEIPHYRVGSGSFWDSAGPSAMVSMMRSIAENKFTGIAHALHWARMPNNAIERLQRATQGVSADQWAKLVYDENVIPPGELSMGHGAREMAQSLFTHYGQWSALARQSRIELAVRGVAGWFASRDERQSHIFHLAGDILAEKPGTISQRLQAIGINNKRKTGEGVALMTLHSAKGLEFEKVWLLGLEDGVLPHVDGEEDEERRLCYVGFTRAMSLLCLSYTQQDAKPSRFIAESGLSGATHPPLNTFS